MRKRRGRGGNGSTTAIYQIVESRKDRLCTDVCKFGNVLANFVQSLTMMPDPAKFVQSLTMMPDPAKFVPSSTMMPDPAKFGSSHSVGYSSVAILYNYHLRRISPKQNKSNFGQDNLQLALRSGVDQTLQPIAGAGY